MENKMQAKIKEIINLVYGESFSDTHFSVLLEKIDNAISVITDKRKVGWDEKDVVLITYADQFSAEGRKPCRFSHGFIISGSLTPFHMFIFYLFIRGLLTTVFLLLITTTSHQKQERGRTSPN